VELVRAIIAAYNARDVDSFVELHAPEIEIRQAPGFPESRPLRGRDDLPNWTVDHFGSFARIRWDTAEICAVSADRVMHSGDWGGEGAASGVAAGTSLTGLFTIRAGQVAEVEFYFDHAEALEAAGPAG
jgi:ketosteroid isomerase-like protein